MHGLWEARIEMMRPGNGLMAAIGVLIGAAVAQPFAAFPAAAVPAALAAFVLTGYGNVLNDILDRHVDQHAHPERPLPSNRISVRHAAFFAVALLVVGLWQAWVAGGALLLAFAAANALLLSLYARWLKAWGVLGNLTVALLVASTFLFGAVAVAGWDPLPWGHLWALALVALLANLARELAKDLEDASHDQDRRTLAQTHPAAAQRLAAGALVAAVVLALWMVLPWGPWWLSAPATWDHVVVPRLAHDAWRIGIIASLPRFLLGAWRIRSHPRRAQRTLKAAMFVALLGYAWGALLAAGAPA